MQVGNQPIPYRRLQIKGLISSGSPSEAEIACLRAIVQGDWIFVSGTHQELD
jgi:hypothetical protein